MNNKNERKIRIAHISRTSKFTGPENILIDILSEMDKEIFIPTVILPDAKGLFYKKLVENNIRVLIKKMPFLRITFNPLLWVWFLFNIFILNLNLFFTFRKEKTDIAVCNTIQEALYVGIAVKALNKKLVIFFKNILDKQWKKKIRAKFCEVFTHGVIGVSRKALEDYTLYASKRNKIIDVIYDSIDCNKMEKFNIENLAKRYKSKSESMVILNIGNLTELKGQLLLLNAISSNEVKQLDLKVLIIGDIYHINEIKYKERLIEFINKNDLKDKVEMLGFQKDIGRFLSLADVLVHCPIRDDAFPRVILEAFCYKKIVIGTSIGGIPEMIRDNYNGFLCKVDKNSLVDKLLYVYNNRKRLNSIKEKAFITAKEDFCLDRQVKIMEKLYKKVNIS